MRMESIVKGPVRKPEGTRPERSLTESKRPALERHVSWKQLPQRENSSQPGRYNHAGVRVLKPEATRSAPTVPEAGISGQSTSESNYSAQKTRISERRASQNRHYEGRHTGVEAAHDLKRDASSSVTKESEPIAPQYNPHWADMLPQDKRQKHKTANTVGGTLVQQ